MKKIKTKILLCVSLIVFAAVLVTGIVSCYLSYRSTVDSVEQTLTEAVEIAADQVAAEINAYVNIVQEFANHAVLIDEDNREERLSQLNSLKDNYGFAAVRMTDTRGIDIETGENLSDMDYFKEIKSSLQPQISEPLLTDYPEMLIYINVPMQKNGVFSGMVMGGLKATVLSDIAANIQIGDGDCTILDSEGNVIAYKDFSQVEEKFNTQELSKTDAALKELASYEAEMLQGKAGFGRYTYEGSQEMMAYAPIPNSNGWSISVAVMSSEFLEGTRQALLITIIIMLIVLIAAFIIARILSNSIARPITASSHRLSLLAEGDLTSSVPTVKTKDETGILADSLGATVEDMRLIITDITHQLGAMAKGDFTVSSQLEYKGDFIPIQQAIHEIADSLDRTLKQIELAADQVSSGSEQVASGSQALSQGTTEQAASVEQLAASINDISEQVSSTAQIAVDTSRDVDSVSRQMLSSDEKMQELTNAMEDINQKSAEIGKIIKTIEDIAFQTNILALNAAVEAARAGMAGKGFAVVADEVRSLANKSQDASKNTAQLIETSVQAISRGTQLAEETALSLRQSVEGTEKVNSSINRIAEAADTQATAIGQVNQGVDQISSVVQTNSATAQESAAASEELSGQAETLKSLLANFQLRDDIGV